MPLNLTGEEKMIGGVMSLRQVGYLSAGVIIIFMICLIPLPAIVKVILGIMIMVSLAILAFIKIDNIPNLSHGISMDKYLILRWEYRKKQKIYPIFLEKEGNDFTCQ